MKVKKILSETMDSQTYKMALGHSSFSCPICPTNKGCNRNRNNDFTSWKNYRTTQWRE